MLYAFFGTDTILIRKEAFSFLESFEKKGNEVVHLTPEEYSEGILVDFAGATSLFSLPQVFLIDTASEKKDVFEDVLNNLPLLSESANTFVLIEGKLLAPEKKKIEKYAKKSNEFKSENKERFNTFLFADAFARKDKKTLWLLLTKAFSEGIAVEEIIGVLFWQLKALRLAAKSRNAGETGLKDFAYRKAKSALAKFKPGEVDTLSGELVAIYHDGHRGVRDIDIALERWILSLK